MSTDRFEQQKLETKEAIKLAFISLLNEKPYDDISVREISQRAKIGFKTYYRHYPDKIKLIQAIMAAFTEQLPEHLEPPLTLEANLKNVRTFLELIEANANMVRAIGRTPLRDTLVQPVIQFAFAEGLNVQVAALGGDRPKDQKRRELVSHHFVQSQFALFLWWLEDDMSISIDEMAEMISELIIKPIWNLT